MNAGAYALIGEAFLIGLFATPHCAAMCGPFALAATSHARQTVSPARLTGSVVLYSLGRTTTYVVLASLAGAFASALSGLTYVGWALSIVAVTLAAAHVAGWLRPASWAHAPSTWLSRKLPQRGSLRPYFIGASTALLPCGMVVAVLALAVTSGSLLISLAVAVAFGIGTSPGPGLVGALGGGLRMDNTVTRLALAAMIFLTGVVMSTLRIVEGGLVGTG